MRSLVLNLFSFCIPYFLPGMLFKVLLYMLHTTVEVLGAGEGEGEVGYEGICMAEMAWEKEKRERGSEATRWHMRGRGCPKLQDGACEGEEGEEGPLRQGSEGE